MASLFNFQSMGKQQEKGGEEQEPKGVMDMITEQFSKAGEAATKQISDAAEKGAGQIERGLTGKETAPAKEASEEKSKDKDKDKAGDFGDMTKAGEKLGRDMIGMVQKLPDMLLGGGDKGASLMAGGAALGGGGIPDLSGASPEKGQGNDKTALGLDMPGLGQMVGVVLNISRATAPQEMSQTPSLGGRGRGADVAAAFSELAGMGKDHEPTRSSKIQKVAGVDKGLEQGLAMAA